MKSCILHFDVPLTEDGRPLGIGIPTEVPVAAAAAAAAALQFISSSSLIYKQTLWDIRGCLSRRMSSLESIHGVQLFPF
jgi:hypothetical protein